MTSQRRVKCTAPASLRPNMGCQRTTSMCIYANRPFRDQAIALNCRRTASEHPLPAESRRRLIPIRSGRSIRMARRTERGSSFESPRVAINKAPGRIKSGLLPLIDNDLYLRILASERMPGPVRPLRTYRQACEIRNDVVEHRQVRICLSMSPD